ncbi:MAG: HAD hydrolase-like protein [Verrucomicrobiota bacterium]
MTVIIGDRMDTDIITGIESGIETVLVLSGVTAEADFKKYAHRPNVTLNGGGEIVT